MSAVIKSGVLTLLGESSMNEKTGQKWEYTVIEMDGRPALFNCLVPGILNNYLNRNLGKTVTLYCSPDGPEIELIRDEEGVVYSTNDPVKLCNAARWTFYFSILLIPFFGLGLFAMYKISKGIQRWEFFMKENPDLERWCILANCP